MSNILDTIHEDEEFVSPVDMNNTLQRLLDSKDNDNLEGIDDRNVEFDIKDFKLADEEIEFSKYMNLINIFNCYFKKLFERKESDHMFEGINLEDSDSTNRCLEFLYEEVFKFNNSNDEDKDTLYDPDDDQLDINKCNELYILCIDHSPVYVCKFLLPLLQYLGEQDWLEIDWSIMPLKNT